MSEIVIVGAGLSGMVAAINLAREGRRVRVLDRERKIGGSPRFHPSVHVTPLNRRGLLDYTGIDVGPAFSPVRELSLFIREKGFTVPRSPFFSVERGSRETSLDSYLYGLAKDAGVEFEFGQPIGKLSDVPLGSIIATGLHPEFVKQTGGGVTWASGFGTHMKSEREGLSALYLDRYSNDYFYFGVMNGLAYGLLFGRYQRVSRDQLEAACDHLEEREGLRFSGEWVEIGVGARNVPVLFSDGMIFTGSSAGMIDPCLGFGIHGALLSGAVAAKAKTDPEGALRDFRRFGRFYNPAIAAWVGMQWLPFKFGVLKAAMAFPKTWRPLTPLFSSFVPGVEEDWWGGVLENIQPRGL